MTDNEMWEFVKDQLEYLRDRFDDHMEDEVKYQRCVQKQLREIRDSFADYREEMAKQFTTQKIKTSGITYLITVILSGFVAWLVTKFGR